MTESLRRNMAWVHGWLGLLAGWLLFAMFLTGTASYFRPEITRWMQPEQPMRTVPAAVAAQSAARFLSRDVGDATQWYVYLPDDRTATTRVFAVRPPASAGQPPRPSDFVLDPLTGRPVVARETLGGEHFYRFHFQLQLPYPWGRWLAGLCAMFMLAAIVSGVVTHKRIFADFFTLRWNKGQRSWLDAHNASAVLALPYHAVVTYTGLAALMAMYMPWPIEANYKQPLDYYNAAYGTPGSEVATGRRVALAPVAAMVVDAERRMGARPATMVVDQPGDATARVTLYRGSRGSLNARGPTLTYSGASGALVAGSRTGGPALSTAGVMLGLHVAQFAGPAMRWVFFLLGLTGAAMVGTGLLLWTAARRRPNAEPFTGLRLVERLNIAAIVALPAGMAAFLLANRVIPATLFGRADLEVQAMFWTWGGLALLQLARPAKRAWAEGIAIAALLFAAVPLSDLILVQPFGALVAGDALFVQFDLAMLAIAALLAVAAWRSGRAVPHRRRRPSSEPIHA